MDNITQVVAVFILLATIFFAAYKYVSENDDIKCGINSGIHGRSIGCTMILR